MYLTIDEQEKAAYLAGTPFPKVLIHLAEMGETLADIGSVGDIRAGFPEEDCLSGPIESLRYLLKYTHKNNKLLVDLKPILEAPEEKQSELTRAAGYGMEELKKLEKTLGITK